MKLLLTLIASIAIYFTLAYYGTSSLINWVVLIVLWTVIDYFTYDKPFTWTDYIILAIALSVVELGAWYNFI